MPARRAQKPSSSPGWSSSTRLQLVAYSALLVATPFLLVRQYLQNAIGQITHFAFHLCGKEIPTVPAVALLLFTVLLIRFRSHLTKPRILAGVVALAAVALAQQITDFYAGFAFYDLQQNWHYIAYAVFAFMMYRDLAPRRVALAGILLTVYFWAMLLSSFDEAFQRHMSARVFDVSDIAKDVCGSLTGLVLIFAGVVESRGLPATHRQLRHRQPGAYFRNPVAVLVLLTALTFLFLFFSSLLTEFAYWKLSVLLTIGAFLVFSLLFHASRFKWGKYSLLGIAVAAVLVQSCFFIKYRNDGIVHNRPGLTVYKGIPVVFFDLMIFPNGMFRLVDRKTHFNFLDRRSLLKQRADIVVVGAGSSGQGGRGFPSEAPSQFVYNRFTQRGTQVIILRNSEACRVYNRLKQEGKSVLLVLHNS
ncbi:MAG: Mth938-like domain-containing protein [Candidatus Eisenbacteria sp.]|nr:Mth938-like domain-containing protein [Candidatus Eisenbacteria bacterium]